MAASDRDDRTPTPEQWEALRGGTPSPSVRGDVLLVSRAAKDDHGVGQKLREAGFAVHLAPLEARTIAELATFPASLILLDLTSDYWDGLAFFAKMRDELGSLAPPAMALVPGDEADAIETALARGVADVIALPIFPALLRVKVARHARRGASCPLQVGSYRIRRVLGRGGMSTVYLAEREGREVALKVLDASIAGTDTEALARFRRETAVLRSVHHGGVPRFLEAGRAGDDFYCAMEYVPGENVARLILRDGALSERLVASMLVDVAAALDAIHSVGLVHRDVKPANVIVGERDRATLVDFGLAKEVDDGGLTRTDHVVGTMAYLAPEVMSGKEPAGPASDAFALGMTCLEALLGRSPVEGTIFEIARRFARGELPRPCELLSGRSPALVEALDGLLAPERARRLALADARALVAGTCAEREEESAA